MNNYFNSALTKKELNIQDCDLAHYRKSGLLTYMKKGNSFLYFSDSIEKLKKTIQSSSHSPKKK